MPAKRLRPVTEMWLVGELPVTCHISKSNAAKVKDEFSAKSATIVFNVNAA